MRNNYSFTKNLILLFVLLVIKPAVAGDANTVSIKKNIKQGYITILADDLPGLKKKLSKGDKLGVHNKKNLLSTAARVQKAKVKKKEIKVIRINSPENTPIQVNKTEKFVFRDITHRSHKTLSDDEINTRTAKIDSLRKQLKSR